MAHMIYYVPFYKYIAHVFGVLFTPFLLQVHLCFIIKVLNKEVDTSMLFIHIHFMTLLFKMYDYYFRVMFL